MQLLIKKYSIIIILLFNTQLVVAQQSIQHLKNFTVCINENEMNLYNLVMQYRQQNGLPIIPLSPSLTYVAQTHCKDLVVNKPKTANCNLHSWSSNGSWSSCCYTADHKQATCMWNKPRELTNYKGNGYEIAFYIWSSANAYYTATPEEALAGWKSSEGHNSVILNKSLWKSAHWNSIGIGIYRGYATIWFGEEKDIEVIPGVCN
jgi:uncharacterized protein YkwD